MRQKQTTSDRETWTKDLLRLNLRSSVKNRKAIGNITNDAKKIIECVKNKAERDRDNNNIFFGLGLVIIFETEKMTMGNIPYEAMRP